MSNQLEDFPDDSTITDSIRDWVDVHPTGTMAISALGGAGAAWLSTKGIELATSIDFTSPQELANTFLGASLGSVACAVTLRKIFGS